VVNKRIYNSLSRWY